MLAFLIITSLSLAFYLGLLVFLYRDGSKRRPSKGSVHKIQVGSVAELGPLPTMAFAGLSLRRQNAATVLVRFASNTGRTGLKSQVTQSAPTKVITLPTFTRDNDDEECG